MAKALEIETNKKIQEAKADGTITPDEQAEIDTAIERLSGVRDVNKLFNTPASGHSGTSGFKVDLKWGDDDINRHQASSMRPDDFSGRTRPEFEYNALSAIAETAHNYTQVTNETFTYIGQVTADSADYVKSVPTQITPVRLAA